MFLLVTTMLSLACSNAAADGISVSTKPLHALVAGIVGKHSSAMLIIDGITSIHHMSLKPSIIRKLHNSKIVIWMGPDIEPYIENSLRAVPTTTAIHDPSSHLTSQDVHWWTDPRKAISLIKPLTDIIVENDPDNQSEYESNAATLILQLNEMRSEISDSLSPFSKTRFLTLHNAYDGFNSSFDLTGGNAIEHNGTVGAKTIATLRKELRKTSIPCVFGEAGGNSAILNALLEGTKTRTGTLDAMGNNLAAGPQFYENLIRQIADTYLSCFNAK